MSLALSHADRTLLIRLVAEDRPRLSFRRIAMKFEALTGRKIHATTAMKARPRLDPCRPLTGREERALRLLIRESRPRCCRAEIARQFEAMTGRPIGPKAVRRRVREMGLPLFPPGPTPREDAAPRDVVRRKAEVDSARERHLRRKDG